MIIPSNRSPYQPFEDESTSSWSSSSSNEEFPTVSDDLVLGGYQFKKISYDSLQPGDIVCTYEGMPTIPGVVNTIALQKLMGNRSLANMVHFEVIVEKLPRYGTYKVAHADGISRKVTVSNENFKEYNAGQALVAFRPTNPIMQKKIVEVATATATPKKMSWRIKILDAMESGNIPKASKAAFKAIRYSLASQTQVNEKELKRLARLAVDYHEYNTFLKKDGKTPLEISCADYASLILNVSLMEVAYGSILNAEQMTREEKIEAITSLLKSQEKNPKAYSNLAQVGIAGTQSSRLVDFLYHHPADFETVGYIGSVATMEDQPVSSIISLSDLPLRSQDFDKMRISHENGYSLIGTENIAGVFHALNIISSTGHLNLDINNDEDGSVTTAFLYLFSLEHQMHLEDVQQIFSDFKKIEVLKEAKKNYEKMYERLNDASLLAPLGVLDIVNWKNDQNASEFLNHLVVILEDPEIQDVDTLINVLKKRKVIEGDVLKVDQLFFKLFDVFVNLSTSTALQKINESTLESCLLSDGIKNLESIYENQRSFLARFGEVFKENSKKIDPFEAGFADKTFNFVPLEDEKMRLLKMQKKVILNSMNFPHKQDEVALRVFEERQVKAEVHKAGRRLIQLSNNANALPMIQGVLRKTGEVLNRSDESSIEFYKTEKNRFLAVKAKHSPDTELLLNARLNYGERPWLHYTVDNGLTWQDEPFYILPGTQDQWRIRFHKGMEEIQYKIYIGTDDPQSTDPISTAKRWQKTHDGHDAVVQENQLHWNKVGRAQLPTCDHPGWE